eukprot:1766618-Rhodomonas_salina.2
MLALDSRRKEGEENRFGAACVLRGGLVVCKRVDPAASYVRSDKGRGGTDDRTLPGYLRHCLLGLLRSF